MESISDILRDDLSSDTEKLEKINTLLETSVEIHDENVDIDKIFLMKSDNIQLKCDVLVKVFKAAKIIHEHVDLSINSSNETSHIPVAEQSRLFNSLFLFSKKHLQFDCLCLTVERINKEALTHEDSILRSREFWTDLKCFLENSQDMIENKKIIYILQICVKHFRVEELNFEFLMLSVDDEGWNTFLILLQVCNHEDKSLLGRSIELLNLVTPIPFFWKQLLFKLMLKHSTAELKSKILTFILSQRYEENYIQELSRIVFSTLREIINHNTNNNKLIQEGLNQFCDNLNIKQFKIILNEMLNIAWDYDSACLVLTSVLIESKNNTTSFDYFHRIVEHFDELLRSTHSFFNYWPENIAGRVATFFWDPEDIDKICKIRRSKLHPLYNFDLPYSVNVELSASNRLAELNESNCDDIEEIMLYFSLGRGASMLNENMLSVHVRLVTYYYYFTWSRHVNDKIEVNQEKTVNYFYEYLMKHLNDNTYKTFKELMINFLELTRYLMDLTFPEQCCREILQIMHNPQMYTNYQVYCAADILKNHPGSFARFFRDEYKFNKEAAEVWKQQKIYREILQILDNPELYTENEVSLAANLLRCNLDESKKLDEKKYYIEVADVWRQLILETADENITAEGLYYVLNKGGLDSKESNAMVEKLLKKHTCNRVARLIFEKGTYSGYLNMDLIPLAYKHLNAIKGKCPSKYEEFSAYFCREVVNQNYSFNNNFNVDNEYWRFCLSDEKKIEVTVKVLADKFSEYGCNFTDLKIHDMIMGIYLNNHCVTKEKNVCLEWYTRFLDKSWRLRANPNYKDEMKRDLKFIINRFKDLYVSNFENVIFKLRIVQALILLVPYVQLHPKDFRNKDYQEMCRKITKILKRLAIGIIVKESNGKHTAVKQICQYMFILLSKDNNNFDEIQSILDKINECPDMIRSFIPVLYHVIPSSKVSSSQIDELISLADSLASSSSTEEQIYIQLLLQRLMTKKNENKSNKKVEKKDEKLQTEFGETDREQCKEILGVDHLFLHVLDPVRDHTMETIFYILPKLNQVAASEWENTRNYWYGIYYSRIEGLTKNIDEHETLKKAVDEFLDLKKTKNAHYTAGDILQIFQMPLPNPLLDVPG